MKLKNYLYLFMTLALLYGISWIPSVLVHEQIAMVEGAQLELSEAQFASGQLISLDGQWHYYDEILLKSDTGLANQTLNQIGRWMSVPSLYERTEALQSPRKGYGTISMTVNLPETPRYYGLAFEYMGSAYKIFINDELMGEVGHVGPSLETTKGIYAPKNVYFKGNGATHIDVEFSNYVDSYSFLQPVKIGYKEVVEVYALSHRLKDLISITIIFTVGAIVFSYYHVRTKQKMSFYFSIFAFLIGIRSLVVNQRLLIQLVPDLPWMVFIRISYVPLFLGLFFFVRFLHERLPGALPEKWVKGMSWLSWLLTTLSLLSSNVAFNDSMIVCVVFCYAVILIRIFIKLTLKLRDGEDEWLLWIAVLLLMFVLFNDAIADYLPYALSYLASIGFMLFFALEGVELSARFASMLTKAEHVIVENEKLVEELRFMNESLESQVTERTKDLEISNQKLKRLNKQLENLSYIDELTRIPNRRMFFSEVEKQFNEAKKGHESLHVFIIDIDYFKLYNDIYGHVKGDWCLFNIAQTIEA
ncbi:MAG: diguanylate cyclase, partial [Clostridia bacterium]|nr:diguanylate cyclase [Clostridia bacterium]